MKQIGLALPLSVSWFLNKDREVISWAQGGLSFQVGSEHLSSRNVPTCPIARMLNPPLDRNQIWWLSIVQQSTERVDCLNHQTGLGLRSWFYVEAISESISIELGCLEA